MEDISSRMYSHPVFLKQNPVPPPSWLLTITVLDKFRGKISNVRTVYSTYITAEELVEIKAVKLH